MRGAQFALVDPPQPAELDDYAAAGAELESALAAVPGARAVYAYGAIRVPGISDLDRLLVVDDEVSVPAVWAGLSERTRRLAMHTPGLVDAETFRRHRLFAHASNLRCVWGLPHPVDERPLPAYAEQIMGTEGLLVMALRAAKVNVTRRVKVRPFLCEFGNLALDLRLVGLEPAAAPHAWKLADAIGSIRREWWDAEAKLRERRLRDALAALPDALAEALAALDRVIAADGPVAAVGLTGAWRNAVLEPATPSRGRAPALAALTGRSHRLAEARWRSVRRTVRVGRAALRVLATPSGAAEAAFKAERDAVVARYADVLDRSPGYSPIGLALAFRAVRKHDQYAGRDDG